MENPLLKRIAAGKQRVAFNMAHANPIQTLFVFAWVFGHAL